MISSKGKQKTLATRELNTLSTGESADDPILIDSLDMLLGMNKTKDAYYKLTRILTVADLYHPFSILVVHSQDLLMEMDIKSIILVWIVINIQVCLVICQAQLLKI